MSRRSFGWISRSAMLAYIESAKVHAAILAQAVIVALHATKSASTDMLTLATVFHNATVTDFCAGKNQSTDQSRHHRFEQRNRGATLGGSFTGTDQATACELVRGNGAKKHMVQ